MQYETSFKIGDRTIAFDFPTYFIADIAANHDGELNRAIDLIYLAKEAGADCAKFQHFEADKIVSEVGFSGAKAKVSHQAKWRRSVVEIYDQYHTRRDWTDQLVRACRDAGIEFMTTPYDAEAVDMFAAIVPAYKIGSGDVTFDRLIERMARIGKPILLATGASDMTEVEAAVDIVLRHNPALCLMQCNTNYTGTIENFRYVNLNVLKTFAERWPQMLLGLSDHTPGHSAVLGAVALGARVIEKHFTDDNSRVGPDHSFAMNPVTWRAMVEATRELEYALGDGVKRVEANEQETVIIQRRALRAKNAIESGTVLTEEHVEALRPCPAGSVTPREEPQILGKPILVGKARGEEIKWTDFDPSS